MSTDDELCGNCQLAVTWDDDGICCDNCDLWFHATCQKVSAEEYRSMQLDTNDWVCTLCKSVTPVIQQVNPQPTGRRKRQLRIGSLNCRGMKSQTIGETKKSHIAEDMKAYDIDILAIQETHINSDEPETVNTLDRKGKFTLYHSSEDGGGKSAIHAGTAIAVRAGTKATFTTITNRICVLRTKISNEQTLTLINAYAPTLPVSEANPKVREEFYETLESVVGGVSKRDYMIIAGDFNAKTGDAWRNNYHQNMGRYGKGETNSNGIELLELCDRQGIILTNTLFKHKMAHRTTWESPIIIENTEI